MRWWIVIAVLLAGCTLEAAPTLRPTPTPQPTSTPSPTATAGPTNTPAPTQPLVPPAPPAPTVTAALSTGPVDSNGAWTPFIEERFGALMALVPTGCFTMGDPAGDDDEIPTAAICIEQPFWVDVYEVSNGAFGSPGDLFTGGLYPRDSVSLPEAIEHCAARGARLPTEAEWEYAARGPDSLIYPWGSEPAIENVTFVGTANGETTPVGDNPGGASWVGALDMAGNLWEWTTSIYDEARFPYPYQAEDGRENAEDTDSPRAIRGGAFSTDLSFVRTASRKNKHPTLEWYGYVGFRCVADYSP